MAAAENKRERKDKVLGKPHTVAVDRFLGVLH